MDSSKLSVKIYLADGATLPKPSKVVPVLHAWIQSHELPNHTLIDVADYAHVPSGPGILLVTDEANIYLDELDGRPGLSYTRKRPIEGTPTDRVRLVFAQAIRCAAMLEANPALGNAIAFSARELSFKINDRLLGPNEPATFSAIESHLRIVATELFGEGNFELSYTFDQLRLFEVIVRTKTAADLKTLLAKIDRPTVLANA